MARAQLCDHAMDVAPRLLGALLAVGDRVGRIVEVEAYGGADDPASHAFGGPTKRNSSMFAGPGTLYCYRSHGIHTCANVVTGAEGDPQAVLIRAVEPAAGVEQMWVDRPKASRLVDLANGPGKLCDALGIRIAHDGVDLRAPSASVRLLSGPPVDPDRVLRTGRIGIRQAAERPWRFCLADSEFVSKGRPQSAPQGS